MKSVFAFEEILGTNWLNRGGIALIVLGVASFGIYELGRLGSVGKVLLSFTLSLAFLVGGILLEKLDRYRIFSYALIGGGWALTFWTTYALNHVQAMRVMSSETTDLILMLAVAVGMAHTLRYRSQVVTGLAFLLAYGTVSLSHDDVYSLSSGVILAIGLVSVVIKMGWFELEVFGILSSYLNHFYWLWRVLGPERAHGRAFPEYHASTAILLFYWLTYRVSYVARKTKSPREEHVSTAAALLNTLLLLGTMKFQSVHPELAFWALLVIGAVEFSLAQLPITRRRREAFVVLSVLGAALMIASVPLFREQRCDPVADRRGGASCRRSSCQRSGFSAVGTARRIARRLASFQNRFPATDGSAPDRRRYGADRRNYVCAVRGCVLSECAFCRLSLETVFQRFT